MSLAQTLLSAAALVLLTVLVVNAHRLVVYSSDETVRAEARDMAVNAAQSLINEISRKRYDQNANAPGASQGWWTMTSPYGLGPGAGEVIPLPDVAPFKSDSAYNDVDDYHLYRRVVDMDQVKGLRCSVLVVYTQRDNPMQTITWQQTYQKRVEVRVTHRSLEDTLRFLRLITY